MFYFTNRDINRLGLHGAIATLGSALSYVFSAVFLMKSGLTPAEIFLAFAIVLALRFVLRPILLVLAPVMGLRRALILGVFLGAFSVLALALVDGIGTGLAAFIVLTALGQVFYCTSYHVFFSTLGDADRRGSQVSAVAALGALAGVFGPALGGLLLTVLGPGPTFGTAFILTLASILPLLGLAEPPVERACPSGAYAAAKSAVALYFADGWMQVSLTTAWSLAMFQALGGRYDSFGGTLSLAALAGAGGGMVLGRFIDLGHARRAVWTNAAILAAGLLLRASVGGDAAGVVAVAVATTLVGGFYLPTWMTPAYNEAKNAPCPLRFQFAAEAGWDAGGTAAGVIAAAFLFFGLPLAAAILLALPMVLVQALVLERSYEDARAAPAAA